MTYTGNSVLVLFTHSWRTPMDNLYYIVEYSSVRSLILHL
jgi:hypothetical protein